MKKYCLPASAVLGLACGLASLKAASAFQPGDACEVCLRPVFILPSITGFLCAAASFLILKRLVPGAAPKRRGACDAAMIFILALGVLSSVFSFDLFGEVSGAENKTLAPFPDVNPFNEAFPGRMDAYVNDRIGFRLEGASFFSAYLNPGKYKTVTKQSKTIVGADGWLFYNAPGENVREFQRLDGFSSEEAARAAANVMEAAEFFRKRGIKFYFFVPPNKHDVYPEKYVPGWRGLPLPSRYEALRSALGRYPDSPLVDVFDALVRIRDRQVFCKNDSHWNYNGGYAAYLELTDAMKRDFPSLERYGQEDVKYESMINVYPGDLVKNLGGYPRPIDPVVQPFPKDRTPEEILESSPVLESLPGNARRVTPNRDSPKVFVVHDSFFGGIEPFFTKSFSEIINRWEWGVSPLKYASEILAFAPDAVVWEVQARYLPAFADRDFNSRWNAVAEIPFNPEVK